MPPVFCPDTPYSLLAYTYMVLSVFWHLSPTFHVCAPFSHSPFRPIPSALFNHSQSTFPPGTPECLLLPPFIYCLLLQSLSVEIRRGPPSLSQAEFPHCKLWKWQLSSRGWSAYLSLGKPSREDSQPHWDVLGTRPAGNNRQRLLFRKGGHNLNSEM